MQRIKVLAAFSTSSYLAMIVSSWFDHSRDLLQMVNHFRSEMPRPIVGIGHSMGATQLVYLALLHPRLLSSLVLLEPVIQGYQVSGPSPAPVRASTFRRDVWPSREAAEAAFSKNRFFQRWDQRVLRLWKRHGLRRLPTLIHPVETPEDSHAVTLTTTKHQEVFTFARPCPFDLQEETASPTSSSDLWRLACPDLDPAYLPMVRYFYRHEPDWVYQNLPYVRPTVFYVFGAESDICRPETLHLKIERTGTGNGGSGGTAYGRVDSAILDGVGHLTPMEDVGRCADAAVRWLSRQMTEKWRKEERFLEGIDGWKTNDARAKAVVSEEWKRRIVEEQDPLRQKPKL